MEEGNKRCQSSCRSSQSYPSTLLREILASQVVPASGFIMLSSSQNQNTHSVTDLLGPDPHQIQASGTNKPLLISSSKAAPRKAAKQQNWVLSSQEIEWPNVSGLVRKSNTHLFIPLNLLGIMECTHHIFVTKTDKHTYLNLPTNDECIPSRSHFWMHTNKRTNFSWYLFTPALCRELDTERLAGFKGKC